MDTEKKELHEKRVQKCMRDFGEEKINLTRDDGTINGEGIWVTPCTKEDLDISKMNCSGTMWTGYLLNEPLSWSLHWGDCVNIRANSDPAERHYARLQDNAADHTPVPREVQEAIFRNAKNCEHL